MRPIVDAVAVLHLNVSGVTLPDLVSIQVRNLLGQFDHEISFDQSWRFVIIHGPNGVGKTKLLELIDAALSLRLARIGKIPFDSATFRFNNESTLFLQRYPSTTEEGSPRLPMRVVLLQPGREDVTWEGDLVPPALTPPIRRVLEYELGVRRVGPDIWRDLSTDEILDSSALLDRYGEQIMQIAPDLPDIPQEIRSFIGDSTVHLIETQRLLQRPILIDEPRRRGDTPIERATVTEFAKDLGRQLAEALAKNSRTSQQLDRSFPRRLLLQSQESPQVSDDEIRNRYLQQNAIRERLVEIGALDEEEELPLPEQKLEDWQRRVLWTYLDDTDTKLDTFKDLLSRVELFREIVNSRFESKRMNIDPTNGYEFVTPNGTRLGPSTLSSGEQHEIVLTYDLLFKVPQGSLVLIDEPEISLHVAWQQQFLNDIDQIAQIASLRFMIATHSPQIVHKWWSQTVSLDGASDGDDL